LAPALARLLGGAARDITDKRARLQSLADRMDRAQTLRLTHLSERLSAQERMRLSLGYEQTLQRGYAVVRAGATLVTSAPTAQKAPTLEIQFADGRVQVQPLTTPDTPEKPKPRKAPSGPQGQGSLF
nr:exodeoxyribonuclease VII large subunit [Gemmobacter sp.]